MKKITSGNFYMEDGHNHESSSLTDIVFKNIDYSEFDHPISFFRSDFSRSRFLGCNFYQNSFGRADFIDVYFRNTDFDFVDFGSCLIKNALFEKSMFTNNSYKGVAIQYTSFNNCVFRDEKFITNMYQCEFNSCTFINCTFTKSSLDCNMFKKCEFIKVDLSECVAENLKFDACSLRDVFLCANLWNTYLYKNTDIYGFGFKYRGVVIDVWESNFREFVCDLLKKKLYFEYLNIIILREMVSRHELAKEFKKVFPEILSQTPKIRKSTLIKILDMFLFYINSPKFSLGDYLEICSYLLNYEWTNIPFDEMLIYDAKLYKMKKTFEYMNFEPSYLMSIQPNAICISRFHINTQNAEFALRYVEEAFEIANCDLCDNLYEKPLVNVISIENGSIILTIASVALLALLVSYVAKKVMHNVFSIQIENGLKKQIIKQLSNNDMKLSDIRKNCELAQNYKLLDNNETKQIDHLSSELVKGEILGVILDFLF